MVPLSTDSMGGDALGMVSLWEQSFVEMVTGWVRVTQRYLPHCLEKVLAKLSCLSQLKMTFNRDHPLAAHAAFQCDVCHIPTTNCPHTFLSAGVTHVTRARTRTRVKALLPMAMEL